MDTGTGTPQAVTVYGPLNPCGPQYLPGEDGYSLMGAIQYNLCQAEQKLSAVPLWIGTEARATLDWLWQRFTDLWASVKDTATRAADAVVAEAKSLWNDSTQFLGDLADKIDRWVWIGLAVMAGIFFFPEILGTGIATARVAKSAWSESNKRRRRT